MPSTCRLVGSHGAEFDTGFAHEIDQALLQRIIDDSRPRSPTADPV